MNNTLKALWQNPTRTLKIGGGIVIGLVLLSAAFQFIGGTMSNVRHGKLSIAPSHFMGGSDGGGYAEDYAMEEEAMDMDIAARGMPSPMPPRDPSYTGGNDAEDYEVTEYNANYTSKNKDKECNALVELKSLEYVVFENENTYNRGCSLRFKVTHEHAEDILSIIKDLKPENLSVNTYTIKRSIENTTSEVQILQEKLISINETLESSLNAYEEISRIATSKQDAGSLATIIDSKVRLIERLTQERININERLNRLEKNQRQQLERLDYTYFHVSVSEDKLFDGKQIKNSWKHALQSFVRDTNTIVQDITIGIIVLLLYVVQYVLYFFILLYTVRFGWKHARRIWKQ